MATHCGPSSDERTVGRRRRVRSAVRLVGSPQTSRLCTTEVLLASVRFAEQCERAGIDAMFVAPGAGVDPFVLLGGIAVVTTSLVLGYVGAPYGQRPPALLAKHATALDLCCSGRALLGIALGSIGDAGQADVTSGDAVGDAVEICRAMLRVAGPTYRGSCYQVESAWNEPRMQSAEPMPLAVVVPAARDLLDSGVQLASRLLPPEPAASLRVSREPVMLAARFAELCAVGPIGLEQATLDVAIEQTTVSARRSLDARSLDAGRDCGAVRLLSIVAAGPPDRQLAAVAAFYDAAIDGVVVDLPIDRLGGDEVTDFAERFGALSARRASHD